jgi:excisionase family DNA binding protein
MRRKARELPWQQRLFVTPTVAAQIVSVSRSRMYELIGSKEIAAVKLGSNLKVPTEALREWARSREAGGS